MTTLSARLYDNDFYGWVQTQVNALRTGDFASLDMKNLIEEVDDMGKSRQRELESRLEVLLTHLLKWKFQPRRRGASWEYTIKEQRRKITKLLKKNPSLSSVLSEIFADAYESSVPAASMETGYNEAIFPAQCPWAFEQAMNADFWPDSPPRVDLPST